MSSPRLDSLLAKIPRGGNEGGVGPSARFERIADLAQDESLQFKAANKEGRLFLGVIGASVHENELHDKRVERYALGGAPIGVADDRHIVTIAGSRAGKGRSVIIPNLITYPGSVLAIDPKGDLARYTADYRADILGQKVVVLDPFGEAPEVAARHAGGFNPLSMLPDGSGTLVEDAGLIADALVVPAAEAKDPHWDETAKQFLEGLILHVATSPIYGGKRNLVSVYQCAMDVGDGLLDEMKGNIGAKGAVMDLAASFFEKGDNERRSVLSSLRRHIRFLGYDSMQNVLTTHSFNLSQLKTQNMTVYLSLPAMRMGTCSRWLRLFVNLTLAALEAERSKPAYPVLMCLDEFATLGRMQALEDAAGQIAGLGCKLWPILQDLGQLQSLYSQRWETFLGNAGVLQFFGNSDLHTLDWISKRLGETTIQTTNQSQPGYLEQARSGATGQSYNESVHSLMTPEEVSRFFGRDDKFLRQLIIRPTLLPMVLQRAYYDQHELFESYRRYTNSPREDKKT